MMPARYNFRSVPSGCTVCNPTSPLGDRWSRTFVQSLNPSSNQLYFPTSSNFPGGVVYPSSFLLPGLRNRGADPTRGRQYSTLSPSWSSSFFHHFFNMIFIDFASILAPKMAPKSSKIQSKIYLKTCSVKSSLLGPNFHRLLMDLGPSLT